MRSSYATAACARSRCRTSRRPPGSLSTCIYYTGLDPFTLEEVYVPKGAEERKMQRALLQYWMPENREYVIKALMRAGRRDLIGSGPKCLVRR